MASNFSPQAIPRDSRGSPSFFCVDCGGPLTFADFHSLGLREPEPGEAVGDYMAEELVDDLAHAACFAARHQAV